MYLPDQNILFIHIPKCAGTSVAIFFTGDDLDRRGTRKHITARQALQVYGAEALAPCFKFSIVRNPWARLLSFYNMIRNNDSPDLVFADWIRTVCTDDTYTFRGQHIWSMSEYLTDEHGTLMMDFVGKVETIGQDFAVVLQKLGRNPRLLPKAYMVQYDKDYRHWYTQETRDLVGTRYREDCERFGYAY